MELINKKEAIFDNYYSSSIEHLLDELKRIDILIMSEVKRTREQISDNPMQKYGISDDEINGLLERSMHSLPFEGMEPVSLDIQSLQLQEQTEKVISKKEDSFSMGVILRLEELRQLFSLSQEEVDILLICLAPEISERYQKFYAYIQDDKNQIRPSVNTIFNILRGGDGINLATRLRSYDLFSDKAALFNHNLVYWIEEAGRVFSPLLNKTLGVDKRIQTYLFESDQISQEIDNYAVCIRPENNLDSLLLQEGFKQQLITLTQGIDFSLQGLVLYFQGGYGLGKQSLAEALCRMFGLKILVVDIKSLIGLRSVDFDSKVTNLLREACLQNAAIYFRDFDILMPQKEDAEDKHQHKSTIQDESLLKLFVSKLEQWSVLCFLAGDVVWEPKDLLQNIPFHRLEVPHPDTSEREQLWHLWKEEYPAFADDVDIAQISDQFKLSGGQIRDALNTATGLSRLRDPLNPQIINQDMYQACRLQSNRQLARLSQKIKPHYEWDDLILPPRTQQIFEEIRARVTHRALVYEKWGFDKKLAMGKGLHLLFAGPPGTGKTMAADVLANIFGLDLYKIDLSTVVSKFIGETEKNLSGIFDEGETSNAVLLFDEADALFGKRTEVKDSHDRHANIEVGYLLQRMEQYSGIVILSTNFRRNMDDAFTRRLHYCVDIPIPEKAERLRIWRKIWPDNLPLGDDLDLDFLAERLEIAGGYIRNIALAAAFMAAEEAKVKKQNAEVSMTHLIQASRREYQKMGQIIKKELLER